MYCIVQVIYGVPLNEAVYSELETQGLEPEDIGCETTYSGAGHITPGWCGVVLAEFDEATEVALRVDSITMKPTPAQKAKTKKLMKALPDNIKKLLPTKPSVYFVFGSS